MNDFSSLVSVASLKILSENVPYLVFADCYGYSSLTTANQELQASQCIIRVFFRKFSQHP